MGAKVELKNVRMMITTPTIAGARRPYRGDNLSIVTPAIHRLSGAAGWKREMRAIGIGLHGQRATVDHQRNVNGPVLADM